MQFSLRDLELLVAVAEAGSIAKAATRCHTVASAISKRLSDLEDSFRTPLLSRSSKGVSLTPAGHCFLVRARGVLNQARQTEEELDSGVRGQVRVFANISAIVQFLPKALAQFLTKHKDIRVSLEEHVSSVIVQAVADRVADVGIVSEVPAGRQVELVPFRKDELVLVVLPGHALARRKSARFADALAYDFVGLHSNSSLHYRLRREAADLGRPLNLRIQVTSFDAVCAMVAAGLGVGIVPRGAATPYTRSLGLASVRLNESWARRELHICLKSFGELSPAARLLVDHLAGRAAIALHDDSIVKHQFRGIFCCDILRPQEAVMSQIAHRWNPADYARHSHGQEVWARELLALLDLRVDEDVLDVGCGDGRMTCEIAKLSPAGRVVGVDRSAEMVAFAGQRFHLPNLSFQTADVGALPFCREFDVIYSSAVLHWVQDHKSALAEMARSLRAGGRCLLQMGGKGNGVEVIAAFESSGARPTGFTYAFHGVEEYRALLAEAGLVADSLQLMAKDMVHPTREAFTGWIRTAWLPYHQHVPEEGKDDFLEVVTDRFVEAHPPDPRGALHVRMVRLQVKAHTALR